MSTIPLMKYKKMFSHWVRMVQGQSYWHQTQGQGIVFEPGRLQGYYNDLRGKTVWQGVVNGTGIPMQEMNGQLVCFPTTAIQKGLGHWDRWLESLEDTTDHYREFIRIAQWLVDSQDPGGGWPIWDVFNLNYLSNYSAMTQGEAISLLVRAYSRTQDLRYLDAAQAGLKPLLMPIEQGGTSRGTADGLVLEEYPKTELDGALNGWIFAIFGLYDYLLAKPDEEVERKLSSTVNTLILYLPLYSSGRWSRYNLRGTIASPFYQDLHIAQLRALAKAFPHYGEVFNRHADIYSKQLANPFLRNQAMSEKLLQKLFSPPEVI